MLYHSNHSCHIIFGNGFVEFIWIELFKREKFTGTLEMFSYALDPFGFGT